MTNIPPFLKNSKAYYFHFNKSKGYCSIDEIKITQHQIIMLHYSNEIAVDSSKIKTDDDFISSLLFDATDFIGVTSRSTYKRTIKSLVDLGYYIPYKRKYLRNPYKIKCLTLDTFLKRKETIDKLVFGY